MQRLLADVPKNEGPVLDPFLGSGTTGLACITTGHDFIGIEREAEYITIATARAKHWKDELLKGDKWDDLTIESEAQELAPVEPVRPQTEASVEEAPSLAEIAKQKPKSNIEDMFG